MLTPEVDRIDPLNQHTTFAYNAVNLLTSRTDRNGRRLDFAYDAADRLTAQTWFNDGGGAAVNTLTYSYDNNDNLLTARESEAGGGAYTFTYDALNRTTTQQDLHGATLTFTYDAVSNRTKVQDSFGGVLTSVYDAADRLTSRQFSGGGAALREDFAYTARNQVLTASRFSDVAGTNSAGTTTYGYDAAMRLTNLIHRDEFGTALANYTYTYDLADRLTSETRNGVTRGYGYDATNQVTTDGPNGFTYDLAGNRTNYVIGANNRILSDGLYTYTYDAEGNRSERRLLDGTGDVTSYSYDHNNQLTQVTHQATVGGAVDQQMTFGYDVFGGRISSAWDADGAGAGVAVTTKYAHDGLDIWADLTAGGSLTTRRIFGDGVDQPLARATGATVVWYLQDRLGSVRELAANSTGALLDVISYGAFGNVESESSPAQGDRYKYTAREYFAEVGLYDYRARNLDPRTGGFIQQDPIFVHGGDVNLYRYVGNNATNWVDPNGLWPSFPGVAHNVLRYAAGRASAISSGVADAAANAGQRIRGGAAKTFRALEMAALDVRQELKDEQDKRAEQREATPTLRRADVPGQIAAKIKETFTGLFTKDGRIDDGVVHAKATAARIAIIADKLASMLEAKNKEDLQRLYKKHAADVLATAEKSSPMESWAGTEKALVNFLAWILESKSERPLSDAEVENLERNVLPALTKGRETQDELGKKADEADPETAKRARDAAPLFNYGLMISGVVVGVLSPMVFGEVWNTVRGYFRFDVGPNFPEGSVRSYDGIPGKVRDAVAPGSDKPKLGTPEANAPQQNPKAYRVQGGEVPTPTNPRPNASKYLLDVDGSGNLIIKDWVAERIHVNVGQEGRAKAFLQRRSAGGPAELIEFEIEPEFLEKLRREGKDWRLPRKETQGLPQKVDIGGKGGGVPDQYAIPPEWFDDLLQNAVPGTAKKIPGG